MKIEVRFILNYIFTHKIPKTTAVKYNSFAYENTFIVMKYYKEKIQMMQ